ncbi:invasin-like protein [Salmonella bongori]|nr:invasin-like protein [Salmonella bongori]
MVFSKKPIAKYITWAIVTSQISLPVIADNRKTVIADSNNEIQAVDCGHGIVYFSASARGNAGRIIPKGK